jgi:hypothetical protein
MDQEPSVLDYVKSRIRGWQYRIFRPSSDTEEIKEPEFWVEQKPAPVQEQAEQPSAAAPLRFPWRVLLVLGLGLIAQLSLEPRQGSERTWQFGVTFYVLAWLFLLWLNWRNELALQTWDANVSEVSQDTEFLKSSMTFMVSLVFTLAAYLAFGGNRFTSLNVLLWFIAIIAMIRAFWLPGPKRTNWISRLRGSFSHPTWNISFDRSVLLFLAVLGLVLFFRTYRLLDVPSQMISDQAEKLWDVGDVLNGQTAVFFQRNTGREFFQFYLTAAIVRLFDTGLTYLSLKIGSVLAGIVTLFYMYLLGKEIANKRVGLLAMALAGIAYWPNVISRYGLRFPLYPLFYAPALYYLVRGLQRRNRNDFLLSGLFVGLGLHGYSPSRMVPFVILLAIGLYLLHSQSKGFRVQAIWGLFALGAVALIVFVPLLRYMTEHPEMVLFRAMTRLGDLEQPLPGPAWQIFLSNLWNSLTMFAWDNGEVWPISVPHRPVLDVVSAVLFHLGVVLLLIRYIRQRHWFDIFTLVSIPVLMLPSILSLAFPSENPSLNRSAAAIVPVFLMVGLTLDSFLTALESKGNRRFAWAMGLFLLAWASLQNYDLVFNQYRKQYDLTAWNTTELGEVVHSFAELTGSPETAWLVGYPHWVDSRLVMINAGFPMQDNAIWPGSFEGTLVDPRPKLFLINSNDTADMAALQSLYPQGWMREYKSKYEGKNFMVFFVPAEQ